MVSPEAHKEYVQTLIENCKKDNSWVVMLKWDKIEVVKTILAQKCEHIGDVGTFIIKYRFHDIDISFYKNGKIIIKNTDDIENLLNNLLE